MDEIWKSLQQNVDGKPWLFRLIKDWSCALRIRCGADGEWTIVMEKGTVSVSRGASGQKQFSAQLRLSGETVLRQILSGELSYRTAKEMKLAAWNGSYKDELRWENLLYLCTPRT
ncbi:hypothetical protein BSNK01_09670 [Bacillaceae bacterium]